MVDSRPFVEAVQELNSGFVRLLESMSALRALSSIQVRGEAEEGLLDGALQVLMQNQDLERCSVFMLQEDKLVNAAGLDWSDLLGVEVERARKGGMTFEVGEGMVGLAAQERELQHCQDCATDQRFLRNLSQSNPEMVAEGELLTKAPVGSVLSAPIQTEERLLGVLNVSHPHPYFFDTSHERTLTVFCNFLAQMVLNNRLVQHMERQVVERTERLEQALSEAETLKQRYEELAVVDELTRLHNRRFFFPETRAALARAMRHAHPFSVMLIDVDHFKRVNDHFGHAAGDQVLKEVAEKLRMALREGDILARFGGEEFVLALPNTGVEGARALAERICEAMRQTDWPVEDGGLDITVSCGFSHREPATEGDSDQLLDRLLQEADQALYHVKQSGRNRCQAFADVTCRL